MSNLSRRQFHVLTSSAVVAPLFAARPFGWAAVSAAAIIDRIRLQIGVDWKADTVDTIKAGDPATSITGIATTAMATLAVLQQAVKSGANLIITSEPTFYGRADSRTPPAGRGARGGGAPGAAPAVATPAPPPEPVLAAKNAFIEKNGLVIFRLNDHWKLRKPDPLATGLGAALGWSRQQASGDPSRYVIPSTSLDALVTDVKQKLGIRGGMRVIGDPQTRITRVALLPGSTPVAASLEALPSVDLIIGGEVREWESAEYARDVVFSGQRKALVLVGRVVSQEGGMRACADWLTTLVPEVTTRHIAAGDPYWRPA